MDGLKQFVALVRERKIGQTVIVYLGSAWVLLEAFSFFMQRYGWDSRLFDAFLIILLFGLPATILIRWYQNDESESVRKKEIAFLSINFIVALFFIVQTWGSVSSGITPKAIKSEKSIAVLPFTNLSHEPDQEYFSDGITEDIISKLYKIGKLHVTSRTSVLMYKNTTKTIPQIAQELGVSYVLEGSVQRSNNKVRITARLIKAEGDDNVWTNTFDNEISDVFAVQSEVAQRIAEELKITLTNSEQKRIDQIPTTNTLAYEYYQQGKFFNNQGPSLQNAEKSKIYFEKAIDADPAFAAAYTGLAETFILFMDWGYAPPNESLPAALEHAQKALQLDSLFGEAYATLGAYHIYYTHDLKKAEECLEKALRLNPGYDVTYHRYMILNWNLKQKDQALAHIDQAIKLNPLSLKLNAYKVQTIYLFRDYPLAMQETERLLKIFPNDDFLLWLRGNIYTQLENYPKAIESFLMRSVPTKETNWALGYAYAKSGETEKARKIIEFLKEKSKTRYIPPSFIGAIYLGLNEKDTAMQYLEKAAEVNDYWLSTYELDPWFDPIRNDPRFLLIQKNIFGSNPV